MIASLCKEKSHRMAWKTTLTATWTAGNMKSNDAMVVFSDGFSSQTARDKNPS